MYSSEFRRRLGLSRHQRASLSKFTVRQSIFTARRYAKAVFAVITCPSVRPSVTSRDSIEATGRIELDFGTAASFHLSHAVFQGNLCTSKISTVYLYIVHRKSDSNGVYLAHPAAQSIPAGYMFCFCFLFIIFTIPVTPIISKSTGPIFATFSESIELWLQSAGDQSEISFSIS